MADVGEAVERLGRALEDTGVPRMPARVVAYLKTSDRDSCTAAELAAALQVSHGGGLRRGSLPHRSRLDRQGTPALGSR